MILTAEQLYALAFEHFAARRPREAIPLLEPLVPHPVVGPDALNLLAVICAQQGDLSRSANFLTQLVAARPLNPDYRANLVTTLERSGNMGAAIEAANDWAGALYKNKRWPEAEQALRRVLQLAPDHRPARCNLAASCEAMGRPEESIAIGLPLLRLYGQTDAPTAELVKDVEARLPAVTRDPVAASGQPSRSPQPPVGASDLAELLPKALCNLANSLSRMRQMDLSIRAYRRSMALAPVPLTEWNLALALLLSGQFDEGWRMYESRWRWDEFEFPDRGFAQPRWLGESLKGRSILVYAEQGFGDTLQFCRFVPRLLEQAAQVTFEVQRQLFPLLQNSFSGSGIRLIPREEDPRSLAEPVSFDVHCGLMSLFHLLRLDMASMPASTAYLAPRQAVRDHWSRVLPKSDKPRIGIVWAGRPEHYKDRERSITDMAVLRPLADLAHVEWHSLQIGPAAARRQEFSADCIDHMAELTDFEQTAALIERLDAVVAVDTAIAHLAGGLGKPVFLLLPYVPDWRWGLERPNSPWYRGLRIFRQPERGSWVPPVAALAKAIANVHPDGQGQV